MNGRQAAVSDIFDVIDFEALVGQRLSSLFRGSAVFQRRVKQWCPAPLALIQGAGDALPEDNGGVPEDEALPEDESAEEGDDDQPTPPPRPDA